MYQLWSGFVPALAICSLLASAWRRVNCHVQGCLRIARYPVDGTDFRVCYRHHPNDEIGRQGVLHSSVTAAWHDSCE